jgi:hypothetical protein
MAQHKLKFQNTAIFKSSFKENYDSNKACRYVHDSSMHKTSSVEVQRLMISLHKTKFELTFNRPSCSYFSFFAKVVSLKVVHPLKIYQNTECHGPTLTAARSLNVRHFGMVSGTALNITA